MWAAGAEAVAINGERIVATTGIGSGNTFMVNGRRLVPPLEIQAVGDAEALLRYLLRRGGWLGLLKSMSFPVVVTKGEQVTVPAYPRPIDFKYVKPYPEPSR